MTRVLVCCGVGGTGKTTTAAALGVGHALRGDRTVVLTIDPARRLADALGLEGLDNTPREVPLDAPGSLHALMLDRKATFDAVITRHSSDPERARRLLDNRYYRAVSTRLTGSHEYMAIEKLYELVNRGDWDVVIVDTPPARHVLDFFEAPDRVNRIFDRTVLRALIQPSGEGWFGGASQRALGIVHRLAGEAVIADVAEFFSLVSDLSVGFRERHAEVAALLASEATTYWLVANAESPERNDLAGFLKTLDDRGMHLGGFLLNRCAAEPPSEPLAPWPPLPEGSAEAWKRALTELVEDQRQRSAAHRSAAHRLSVKGRGAPVWLIPELGDGLQTTGGLARLARWLPPNPPPVGAPPT